MPCRLLCWGVDGWTFYVTSCGDNSCEISLLFCVKAVTVRYVFCVYLACAVKTVGCTLSERPLVAWRLLSCRHSSHSSIIGRLFGSATNLWSRTRCRSKNEPVGTSRFFVVGQQGVALRKCFFCGGTEYCHTTTIAKRERV